MMLHETDVVILGAGAAGLVTALNARGRRVTVIMPGSGEGCSSSSDLAAGGLAAAVGRGDSPSLHMHDTLQAGREGCDMAAVRRLCVEGPDAVAYLESIGVRFAREGEEWSLHTEAAHSRARVLHVGDATGAAIMLELRSAIAAAAHVEVMPCTRAVSLLRNARGVCGVAALSEDGSTVTVQARAVVIATGGVGGLFARSTNPIGACGDGPAMALAVGARCNGLEFVQFHPTALDVDVRPSPLLTEALRGAGARLIDDSGQSIMAGVHPLAELAPRDVVARAVYQAQQQGRRVLLESTCVRDRDLAAAFPSAHATCLKHGFDLRREPVPVTPAAHYHMGGIAVDLDGRTNVPGLWAVGEAACTGAHGANRLASNSLLEAVVFGRRVGHALSRERFYAGATDRQPQNEGMQLAREGAAQELRELMWRCMGVVRSAALLAEGLERITRLREETAQSLKLDHARLRLAEQMLVAAHRRTVSCGAHFRSDAARAAFSAAS